MEFILKTQAIVGKGSLHQVPSYLEENQFSRVGMVVDQALITHEEVKKLMGSLKESIAIEYVYDLKFEPDYDSLDKIKVLFKKDREPKVDVIVAIGGGSTIDFAKGIATLIRNHEPAITYRGFPKNINPSIPIVAIPTTAGTASEVTYNAVFIDYRDNKKLGINTYNNFPVLAVLDSNMTKYAPYGIALSSGLDALVHSIESFGANQHNSMTRIFAREAFKNLFNSIEMALTEVENDQARENMLLGAYQAGISLMNSGSGPSGAISYALGTVCKIPHGIAGGMTLPFLIKHNVQHGYTDYTQLYDLIDGINSSLSEEAKSKLFANEFFNLFERLNVWEYARKHEVNVDENEELQAYLGLLQGAFDQNPLPFTYADSVSILQNIYSPEYAS